MKGTIQLKNYYKGICKNYKEVNKKIQSVIILMDSTDVVYGKFFYSGIVINVHVVIILRLTIQLAKQDY